MCLVYFILTENVAPAVFCLMYMKCKFDSVCLMSYHILKTNLSSVFRPAYLRVVSDMNCLIKVWIVWYPGYHGYQCCGSLLSTAFAADFLVKWEFVVVFTCLVWIAFGSTVPTGLLYHSGFSLPLWMDPLSLLAQSFLNFFNFTILWYPLSVTTKTFQWNVSVYCTFGV